MPLEIVHKHISNIGLILLEELALHHCVTVKTDTYYPYVLALSKSRIADAVYSSSSRRVTLYATSAGLKLINRILPHAKVKKASKDGIISLIALVFLFLYVVLCHDVITSRAFIWLSNTLNQPKYYDWIMAHEHFMIAVLFIGMLAMLGIGFSLLIVSINRLIDMNRANHRFAFNITGTEVHDLCDKIDGSLQWTDYMANMFVPASIHSPQTIHSYYIPLMTIV